ncbi:SURF1 family cytochrome oxidase biogenesis protein [Microbacterium sp. CJ88]|uniref:SURF1 family cytochrome oxidase biogenesis protein n=1 Tax=Microbacterium sp. CJ88 TaxID=3445672 RepID=UPI003F6555CD
MSRRTAPAAVRWTVYVAIAIVFAIACAFLSNWQFSRNAWRSEQLALVAANYDAAPVPLADAIPADGAFQASDEWLPVMLQGRYLADQQLLARNRPHGGTSAFEVLVPFRLDDGRIFLVDRGWVPPGRDQPDPDAVPAPPAGETTVVVRLRPGEDLPRSGRETAPAGQVPTINLPLVAAAVDARNDAPIEQSAYGQLVSEDPAPASAPQAVDAPSADPGPYLSYAVQWILFAVMGFVFIGYVIRSERRHRREDLEAAAEAAAARAAGIEPDAAASVRTPRTRTRPRDRDAEDEDALLDSR